MRNYELMFIVHPDEEEAGAEEVLNRVSSWITDAGGTIEKVDKWGKRKLAYPINKQREGYYYLLFTTMPPTTCNVIESSFQFMENVLRYLIIKNE